MGKIYVGMFKELQSAHMDFSVGYSVVHWPFPNYSADCFIIFFPNTDELIDIHTQQSNG